jgi:hypothetical protein
MLTKSIISEIRIIAVCATNCNIDDINQHLIGLIKRSLTEMRSFFS